MLSSTILAGQLPGEKLRRSNEFEGDLIYTYYCSAIRLEGPNFGPVGPPLRMPRPGRSGPLWVPLCSGRSGRGLWACSVGRADRPGLHPDPRVSGILHYRALRFGDPQNDGTRAYSLPVNAILRGHFGLLHPGYYQDVFYYLKTRCCLFCWCASYI